MSANDQSLREYFVSEITNEILNSNLKPGDKIKSIRDLAIKHHVSRSVIQNGLKDLAMNGLIEKDSNNHYIVKSVKKYDRIETLLHFLSFKEQALDELEKKSILEIKYAMDALAIDLLRDRLSLDNYNRLLDILNIKLDRNEKDFPELAALEYFRFMKEFYLLTNNMFMPLFINSFINPILLLIKEYCDSASFDNLFTSSKKMLKALYEGRINDAKEFSKNRFLNM